MSILLEVCVETIEDACVAAELGAQRLELCSALSVGGVTPSLGMAQAAVEETALPCIALIRPRGGDFLYSEREAGAMLRDVERLREVGCAGIAIGALTSEAQLAHGLLREMVDAAGEMHACLHRAFDATTNLEDALETAVQLGLRRILTSGGAADAAAGKERIAALVALAQGRIEILPGGGVRSSNAAQLVRTSGVDQVHSSCGGFVASEMRERPAHLVLGRGETGDSGNWRVDPLELRALLEVLGGLP